MRVRFRSLYAGPRGNFSVGEVANFPDAEAAALVAGKYADSVDPAPPVRAAPVVEQAVEAHNDLEFENVQPKRGRPKKWRE